MIPLILFIYLHRIEIRIVQLIDIKFCVDVCHVPGKGLVINLKKSVHVEKDIGKQ